jgi:glycosyltransferase involved in cell wall biosynthesis
MRIGFLTTSLSNEGGWGRYSKSLIEAVSAHAEVTVLTMKHAENSTGLQDVHACLPRIGFHPLLQCHIFFETLHYLRGCDIVHALVEPYAPGAALAARLLRKRFVMTLHGTYSAPPPGWSFHRFFLRRALRTAVLTTTGSRRTEERAREVTAFRECRFIPNGVDTETFRLEPDATIRPFLLTTGAVKPRKGADIVVRALGMLHDEFPELTYKIVGDSSSEGFVEKIRSLAQSLGVAERVELLGIVDDAALRRLYNECIAFILASRDTGGHFEGFPMVYFEANACGAPVITTEGYGSEYAVHNGENGFLVPAEDPAAVADAVRNILREQDLRARLRDGALKMAAAHTWDRIAAEQLMPFYQDAMRANV